MFRYIACFLGVVFLLSVLLLPLVAEEESSNTIKWPGKEEIVPLEIQLGSDTSGLDFSGHSLYVVDNRISTIWILDRQSDGSLSYAAGFENGKKIGFIKDQNNPNGLGPDAEGITVADDSLIYIASERDNGNAQFNCNKILQFNPFEDSDYLTAIQEWDLTDSLPDVVANKGIEAVEWVANSEVTGKLFDQNTNAPFDPNQYPNAIADGVFFVALEENGHIYAYVLMEDGSYIQLADLDSLLGCAMGLDYDEHEHVLWVTADDTGKNLAAQLLLTGEPAVNVISVPPPEGVDISANNEGFAIATANYIQDGDRPVYRAIDGIAEGALTEGSLSEGSLEWVLGSFLDRFFSQYS